jgi:hypothetical protein
VLAPDVCVRYKHIPAIMLNAQGVNISDPTPGRGTGAGTEAGAGGVQDDESTRESAYVDKRMHHTVLSGLNLYHLLTLSQYFSKLLFPIF